MLDIENTEDRLFRLQISKSKSTAHEMANGASSASNAFVANASLANSIIIPSFQISHHLCHSGLALWKLTAALNQSRIISEEICPADYQKDKILFLLSVEPSSEHLSYLHLKTDCMMWIDRERRPEGNHGEMSLLVCPCILLKWLDSTARS